MEPRSAQDVGFVENACPFACWRLAVVESLEVTAWEAISTPESLGYLESIFLVCFDWQLWVHLTPSKV